MAKYKVPNEYFFRIHHVRPRFKNDVESVLLYMADQLVATGEKNKTDFRKSFNDTFKLYPGNYDKADKTIDNYRTELSALFGFIERSENIYKPSTRAKELAQRRDLVEAFKVFLFLFQYPGAHIKSERVLEQIQVGIHFKPAQCILKVLDFACKNEKKSIGLTKAEVCHCIFTI